MIKKQKIVYMIPTYNERENIESMLSVVNKILLRFKRYDFNILIVDDNSPDGTAEIVNKFIKKHSSTILLSGPKKGLGTAMIRGYKYAMKKLKADIVISNESDFSYNPSRVATMIQMLEAGKDVVLGGRRLENTHKWPLNRRLIHFLANTFFAKIIAGVTEVEDHNSAFKAVRVKGVLDQINFKNFPSGFSFFNYFTFKLSRITSKIYEFKTTFRPRTKGVSKMILGESKEYIKNCMRIRYEKTFK